MAGTTAQDRIEDYVSTALGPATILVQAWWREVNS
eukprot:COSAG06_NODE_39375_length_413_cov_0.977707_1_plen_34_part_10